MSVAKKDTAQRRAQKRVWEADPANRPKCQDCGAPTWRTYKRCAECHRMVLAVARDARRAHIALRWLEGATRSEIAAELKSTRNSIGFEVAMMRRDGWDMPDGRARSRWAK